MAKSKAVGRLVYLDLFKTLLVYGMIGTHVIQLLGFGLKGWTRDFADFINLVSFSGFMLAFGIGTGLGRKDGRGSNFGARLVPILLMVLAVYVSSLGYVVLVEERALSQKLLVDLFTMRVLFGWSEFLATFLVLYIFIALARPILLAIAGNVVTLLAASLLCLAATLVTFDAGYPLSGAIIGTNNYPSFPLIPYLPWFLVGLHLGQRGAVSNLWLFGSAIVLSGIFVFFWQQSGQLPPRFPPGALWVIGPALPLMVYLFVSQVIAQRVTFPPTLLLPGRHVLLFLVVSNLAIFATRHFIGRPVRDWPMILIATLAIVLGASLVSHLLDMGAGKPVKRRR